MEEEIIIVSGIYKWINPKGRIYVGQAENLDERKEDYKYICNVKKQRRLYNSFVKYGLENHIFEIIERCLIEDLNKRERHWQDFYNVLSPMGLNCVLQDADEKRKILSEETKKRIAQTKIGIKASEETKKRMSISQKAAIKTLPNRRGYSLSEEHKRKIGEANSGFKHSEETREKMSLSKKGKIPWNKGVPCSEEQKDKISKSNKGRVVSEETRQKISKNSKNKTDDIRKKMSEALRGNKYALGYKATEEARKKMSEFQKTRLRKPVSEETKRKISETLKNKLNKNNKQ